MSKLYCIDANICVWCIKKQASPGQEHMIPRAETFIDFLEQSGGELLLPAPVLTELLAVVPNKAQRDKISSLVFQRFMVMPFDAEAAQISGDIWSDNPSWKNFYKDDVPAEGLRNGWKYDLMILGIALANKVTCLYTTDSKLINLASKVNLNASEMPLIGKQTLLEFSNHSQSNDFRKEEGM